MKRPVPLALLLAATLPLVAAESPRSLRDPMQPPAAARAAAPAAAEPAAAASVTARHLLVVDGRRYVVDGNRRRGVGDTLGDARIERIEDAAVVLRTTAGSQRIPLFGGVVKQSAADNPAAPRTERLSNPGGQP